MKSAILVTLTAAAFFVFFTECYNHYIAGPFRSFLVTKEEVSEYRSMMHLVNEWIQHKALEDEEERKFNDVADMLDNHNPYMAPPKHTPGVKK